MLENECPFVQVELIDVGARDNLEELKGGEDDLLIARGLGLDQLIKQEENGGPHSFKYSIQSLSLESQNKNS